MLVRIAKIKDDGRVEEIPDDVQINLAYQTNERNQPNIVFKGVIQINIFVVRHGETDLNRQKRMQSICDMPLNAKGLSQAKQARDQMKQVHFDAAFASPFQRTINTAAIIANVNVSSVIKDERLSEVHFGKYEFRRYACLGLPMTLYWLYPEIFPAPVTAEGMTSVKKRVSSFISDLRTLNYENVLICSHGNLIRVLANEFDGCKRMITWKTFPQNCEIKLYRID